MKNVSGIAAASRVLSPCWHRQALRRRRDAVLRVAAARDQRADAIPVVPPSDARPASANRSRDLEPGNVRCARRRRIVAEPLNNVRPVDAGGLDPDQDLAGSGQRNRPFGHTQDTGATRVAEISTALIRGFKAISFRLSAAQLSARTFRA